jgi:subtilisin family serine protease
VNVGVAKNVSIFAARVLNQTGAGTVSSIIAAINAVVDDITRPQRIISMSLGGARSSALNAAVDAASAAGVLVVVAAGNENLDACRTSPGEHWA